MIVTDVPNAAGATSGWTGSYADLTSDDGDVSCIFSDSSGATHQYKFPNLPVGTLDPITACTFNAKARAAAGSPTMAVYTGTGWGSLTALGGGYGTVTVNAASLVVATLQAYESGVQRGAQGVGNTVNCSYATRAADVEYPPGGFAYLVGSLLAGLSIGAALTFREFTAALSTFARGAGRRLRFTQAELEMGYRFYRRTQTPELAWL